MVKQVDTRDLKSLAYRKGHAGSIPASGTSNAPLAHGWLEQRTHNPLVRGSTPRGGTK